MNYGYARCSTNELKQDIDRQKRELIKQGVSEENIYFEYESGTKIDRVEFNRLLEAIDEGDTIIATEVSRITRSTKQLCEIIDVAKTKKIKLILGSFVVDCTVELDALTEGILKLVGVISELERNMISERVKSGIVNARAKGKVIGRPSITENDIPQLFFRHYPKFKSGDINKSEFARLCGLSYPTVYKYIDIVEKNK